MADTPTPRSYAQILSDSLDTFLSKIGLKKLKVGNPILTTFEANAQSVARASQDTFNLLKAKSLDNATGTELDNIGNDEKVPRIKVTPSSGFVNFIDTSFTKISSSIYQGSSAPNAGTTQLKVADASLFPNSGSIYIGRGTVNLEGPITYTSKTNNSTYWTLTLSSGTNKFHNLGESVIVAQGGNRVINSGTIVQTPQGNASDAVTFTTLYSVQIDDGETEVDNVEVTAQTAGTIGNVPAGAISQVTNAPFVGASVTNPLPFTNGLAAESDDPYRERIKDAKQSRQKGTTLALATNAQGVTSSTDNKTVISASVVDQFDGLSTLYIDDGTGYEETTAGIPSETLVDIAEGGEQLFQLSAQRPITKAFVPTSLSAPFNLHSGDKLSVLVGGVLSEHTFDESEFISINNATAFEVVASINANSTLLFNARPINQGTQVAIFAKAETQEDLQVVTPNIGNNANQYLGFSTLLAYTLNLYKNDDFLYKDGKSAIVTSNIQSEWSGTITSGDTLTIQIDGTATQTITVTDSDFANNNTGYSTVNAANSLTAWATVLNLKIAGATVTGLNGVLSIVSNLGASARAKITIIGGTLVSKGMFVINSTATGKSNDYSLNRNTGQLKLTNALSAGDTLTVSTAFSRAYIASTAFTTSSLTLSGTANLWLSVDYATTLISTGVNASTALTISSLATNRARYTLTNNSFNNLKVGDWVIVWDPQFTDKGMWRVSDIDGVSFSWFEVERSTITAETKTPTSSGIVFARSTNPLQNIQIAAGTYTLTALASAINTNLIGATASVFRNSILRISTNTYDTNAGSVFLIAADIQGQLLNLPVNTLVTNSESLFATLESGNVETGTPNFDWTTIATVPSGTTFTLTDTPTTIGLRSGDFLFYKKRLDVSSNKRYGADANDHVSIDNITGTTITPRINSRNTERLVTDRVYGASPFGMASDDNFSVIVDQDPVLKNFNIPLARNIKPNVSAVYGTSAFSVLDVDNGNLSLFQAFGTTSTFFNDFALYMRARGKSHSILSNGTILWRNALYGSDGNNMRVSYVAPGAANSSFALTTDTSNGYSNVKIQLPSGNARSVNTDSSQSFIFTTNASYTANSGNVSRTASTVTVTLATAGITNVHTLSVGDQVYQTTDQTTGNVFRAGPKNITAVTANTFSYTEAGTGGVSNTNITYVTSKQPAGTSYTVTSLVSSGTAITVTIGAHIFNVGDTVYFEPGHFDATSNITIADGAKVLTAVAGTTVTWAEATTAATATLVSGVNYTISSGQVQKATGVYFKAQAPIGNLTRASGIVTATIQSTPIISTTPFNAGDIVYLSPGEANFPSGPKIITSSTGLTFTYVEAGSNVSSTSNEYFTANSTDINISGNGVVAGDIVHIDAGTGYTNFIGNYRVAAASSTTFSFLLQTYGASVSGFTVPATLKDPNYLSFYPLSSTTAASVVSWVNANTSLISATLVPSNGSGSNNGTATITTPTLAEYNNTTVNASLNGAGQISVPYWSLFDGLNFIEGCNISNSNSNIALKSSVSGELTSNADFTNENMRLVPVTALNLANYFGSTAISGFGANSLSTNSFDGNKLQLSSISNGSTGALQVTGGTANSVSASVIGSGTLDSSSTYTITTIASNQLKGLTGDLNVALQGNASTFKATPFVSGTNIQISAGSSSTEWLITLTGSGTTAVNVYQAISTTNTYQIEKHGNFIAYIDNSAAPTALSGSIKEGDWVYIKSNAFSQQNTGIRQIVRIDASKYTFWVENSTGVEEIVTMGGGDFIKFISYDSVMPGDIIINNTSLFGAGNTGSFVVEKLSESGASTDANKFYLTGNMVAAGPIALSTQNSLFQVQEATPIRLIKKIRAINATDNTGSFYNIVFNTGSYYNKISESVGTTIKPLDKLDFSTDIVVGLDGYQYNTGLLAEVNKVIYGDESNPAIYPGVVAASSNVNISGPLVKRIEITIGLRLRTGTDEKVIKNRVRSAVASVINSSAIGQSIALSNVVAAAEAIDGVKAVTIISPTYSVGNDLIIVQPNEKPLILDITNDILISVVS